MRWSRDWGGALGWPAGAIAVLLLLLAGPSAARAAPGDLDPSFGTAGRVGLSDHAWDLRVLPDDGFLVLAPRWVARYLPDGDIDTSFGEGGYSRLAQGRSAAFAVDARRRIIVAGMGPSGDGSSNQRCHVHRFLPDGSLDASFGSGGFVAFRLPRGVRRWTGCTGIAADRNRIVLSGGPPGDRPWVHFVVARLKADGDFDRTFAGRGARSGRFAPLRESGGDFGRGSAVTVDRHRRIVVGGYVRYAGGSRVAFARFTPDGRRDRTFSRDGRVLTGITTGTYVDPVIVDRRQRLLAACHYEKGPLRWGCVTRRRPDGGVDRSFAGGTLRPRFQDYTERTNEYFERIMDIAIAPDGRIVMVGWVMAAHSSAFDVAVLRVLPSGRYDPSFSGDGVLVGDLPDRPGADEELSAVGVQENGDVLVAGFEYVWVTPGQYNPAHFVARLRG